MNQRRRQPISRCDKPSDKCSPNNKLGWKAFTLRWPYLITLTVLSLVMLTSLEALRRLSKHRQGLLHLEDPNGMSTREHILYNYLPTVLAVSYSIAWSFIDADAKRLEPYLQLRRPRSPASILLLDYLFQSPFMVPFRALKSKHWTISLVAIGYLLISQILPASAGAIFTIKPVSLFSSSESFRSLGQIDMPRHFSQGSFMLQLQAILESDGENLPPWSSMEYAVEPFTLAEASNTRGENNTWRAETTVAFADPHCTPMEVSNWTATYRCCTEGSVPGFASIITYLQANLRSPGVEGEPCDMKFTMARKLDTFTDYADFGGVHAIMMRGGTLGFSVPMDANLYDDSSEASINLTNSDMRFESHMLTSRFHSLGEWSSSFSRPYEKDIERTCSSNPRISAVVHWDTDGRTYEQLSSLNRTPDNPLGRFSTENQFTNAVEAILTDTLAVNLSIVACRPKYYSAVADVLVNGDDGKVLHVDRPSQLKELDMNSFNATDFESIVDCGAVPSLYESLDVASSSSSFEKLSSHHRRIPSLDFNASEPGIWAIRTTSNLAQLSLLYGFDFFNRSDNESSFSSSHAIDPEYSDYRDLGYIAGKLWQAMFASAFSTTIPPHSPSRLFSGTSTQNVFAVVINPAFAILAEVILGLAALLLVVILCTYYRRKSILHSDPDSISAQCSLIADLVSDLGPLRHSGSDLDRQGTKSLMRHFQSMDIAYGDSDGLLTLSSAKRNRKRTTDLHNLSISAHDIQPQADDRLPFFVTKTGICFAMIALFIMTSWLVFLVIYSSRYNGFTFRREFQSVLSQLLWSFLPSLIATGIGSCWNTIHRDQSVLESWVCLGEEASFSRTYRSLSLKYASRPPLIVLWHSLKNKHYSMALVSFICLTTNVLNVSMAALFNQNFRDVSTVHQASRHLSISDVPNIWPVASAGSQNSLPEAWEAVYNNISHSKDLPRWTSQNYVFAPTEIENAPTADAGNFFTTIQTQSPGLGALLNCTEFPSNHQLLGQGLGLWTENLTQFGNTRRGRARFVPSSVPNGSDFACESSFTLFQDLPSTFFHFPTVIQRNQTGQFDPWIYRENRRPMGAIAPVESQPCMSELILSHTDIRTQETSFYLCSPKIEAHMFEVTRLSDGTVVTADKCNESSKALDDWNRENSTLYGFSYAAAWMPIAARSHKITNLTDYDMPGFLMTHLMSRDNTLSVADAASNTFARTFVMQYSVNRDMFITSVDDDQYASEAETIDELFNTRELRIVASIPAFGISLGLLVFYLAGFVFMVSLRRHRYSGPRMPVSIGSLIPWVMNSRMLVDFRGLHVLDSKRRDDVLASLDNRYGFGRFKGRDQRIHLGIEYEELLIAKGAYGDF